MQNPEINLLIVIMATPREPDAWDAFQLPFDVATVQEYNQRAFLTRDASIIEWQWLRLHAWCDIATPPGRMMALNRGSMLEEFKNYQIPDTELQYRGSNDPAESPCEGWRIHGLGSRGYLASLIWLMKNRALKSDSKTKAFKLFLGMVGLAFGCCMEDSVDIWHVMVMLIDRSGSFSQMELVFESGLSICRGSWESLLRKCQGGIETWKKLSSKTWRGRCITTPVSAASLEDILHFLLWIVCNPKTMAAGQSLYKCIAALCLPRILQKLGAVFDSWAQKLCRKELNALPILKNKAGRARRQADPVNRMILLYRLRRERLNRLRVAETHEELGNAAFNMTKHEAYVDCMLHQQSLAATFNNQKQIAVCWDPSSYTGKEVLVAAVYSSSLDQAGWLMNQELHPMTVKDLHDDLLPFAKKSKLTRITGYNELRGLSAALRSIGMTILDFAVPHGLIARPLTQTELRIEGPDGRWWIWDSVTGSAVPQTPPSMKLHEVPLIISMSDQGPVNTSALNFLQYSGHAVMLRAQFDTFHRSWNDIKTACRRSICKAWKVVLQLTLVANLSYGPFGASQFFYRKVAKLREFLATQGTDSSSWQKYVHLICLEQRRSEPRTEEEGKILYSSVERRQAFSQKGPLVKLMRWFSWFESMTFLSGSFFIHRMILENAVDDQDEESADAAIRMNADPAQELRELKKKKGAWKLAPTLITEQTLCVKDCIMAVGKATWKQHAAHARELTNPMQVLAHNVSCAGT